MEVETYSQNNFRFIEVNKLHRELRDMLCRAFPGYHAFMGCDYTAVFCREGKVRPFKILENNLKCQEAFGRIGFQEKINEDDSNEIEKYVCAIYGRKRLASVDEVRLELFLKKYKPKESKLISNTKKFDGSQLTTMFTCAERKDQANQIYNWGLAFISTSITARSIGF